jgi:pyridoxal phosphate enzyme (YggS family)
MVYIKILMIHENIERLLERIGACCSRIGRDPKEITVVAVAKTFRAENIREAVRAGVEDIGENYIQELVGKRELRVGEPVRWHFVGHLQRNKVKYIAPWIHMVHAVDSVALGREIDKRATAAGRAIDILLEVNTTGEDSKFGVSPESFGELIEGMDGLQHIRIAGLMTIGPLLPDPEGSRPMFRRLRHLKEEAARRPQHNVEMHHLSMGMTGDLEVALEEGATILRVGTAVFGSRTQPV